MQHPRRRRGTPLATIALLFALVPLSSAARLPKAPVVKASAGLVVEALHDSASQRRAAVMGRLAARGSGTYIGEILAHRDSALARWPERRETPLAVWIQHASTIPGWQPEYVDAVSVAFGDWNAVDLPVGFRLVADSADADVHVTFIDHFDEEISGRTRWIRNDDWWITNGDITLAVNHRAGPRLDTDAMHAMALHEVGHLLGLDHTGDASSVMAPRVRVRSLSEADERTALLLYSLPAGALH